MTDIIDEGWADIHNDTDHLIVFFEKIKVDFKLKGKPMHYDGAVNIFIPGIGKQYLIFKVFSIHLTSHTNFSNFIDYIKDFQAAGAFKFKVIRNTSDDYTEWDGDNTEFTVAVVGGLKGLEKLSPEDGDDWICEMIVFEQVG